MSIFNSATIRDISPVNLPPVEVELGTRVEKLHGQGLQMSIYARNFIALPFLQITRTGLRNLALATFDKEITTKKVISKVEGMKGYSLALVEDFIALLELQDCTKELAVAIVCPAAQFKMSGCEMGVATPYVVLGDSIKEHNVGLANEDEDISWSPGVAFLLVKE